MNALSQGTSNAIKDVGATEPGPFQARQPIKRGAL